MKKIDDETKEMIKNEDGTKGMMKSMGFFDLRTSLTFFFFFFLGMAPGFGIRTETLKL